jgi:type I restriction enzyme S subunit
MNKGKALTPKLRFPEFREAAGWETGKVNELVDTVTPPKKLPTSHYASKGAFPIIDQSQADICGWTDDHEALIQDGLPLIIFGDHTCILKLIDRPFAQGADGIKILKSRPKVGTPFLYQFLTYRPVVTEEYKRHYSILKEKLVAFPDPKTGEQQKIAECLSAVDELIAVQARKLDALKTHKKGLMQQLFPAEGETLPKLRFPEFREAGEWDGKLLGDICQPQQWATISSSDLVAVGFPVYGANGFIGYYNDFNHEFETVAVTCRGSTCGEVLLIPPKSYITGNSMCLDGIDAKRNSYHFVFQLLKHRGFRDVISGSAQPQIVGNAIKRLRVALPKHEEQQKIADCLTSLDDLITAQTQKLAALKTHKKGLMQQLFPSAQAVEA